MRFGMASLGQAAAYSVDAQGKKLGIATLPSAGLFPLQGSAVFVSLCTMLSSRLRTGLQEARGSQASSISILLILASMGDLS